MIKTGIYGILRIYGVLNLHSPAVGGMVLVFGVFAGVLGVVYALGQHDLKRLLAYHSVENIGIILIGMGIGMIGVEAQNPIMAVLGFAGASCTCSITPSSSPFFSWARAWSCIKPEPLPSTPWAVC